MPYPAVAVSNMIALPVPVGPFGAASLAISQVQVALKLIVNDATTGSNLNIDMFMPYAGEVVGIAYQLNTNKVAGALSVSPTLGAAGAAAAEVAATSALYRLAMANATRFISKFRTLSESGLRFKAGDNIGAKVTTDGSFAPAASADLLVWLYVAWEDVRL